MTNMHVFLPRFRLFLSAALLLSALSLSAQPAPDFTITDSEGNQHTLYQDYLDQGKTVLIKLFFTFCPPCNTIAPFTQPLYESWGEGNGDVEFFSLSIQPNDNSPAVNSYKSTHSLTYPGAGADGDSNEAAAPYMDGTYGFFLGTPTFIVIAPDGTVNYNVRGGNPQATIDSLDAAIAATGAMRPLIPFPGPGNVAMPDGQGIGGVQLYIEGLADTATTLSNGSFLLNTELAADQTYQLRAQRPGNHAEGLSNMDQMMVLQHLLGLQPLTGLQLIAADTDRDGRVSIRDAIRIRKAILGLSTDFDGQDNWIFLNAEYDFQQPDAPWDEAYNGSATSFPFTVERQEPLQLIGVKTGDVDNSAL